FIGVCPDADVGVASVVGIPVGAAVGTSLDATADAESMALSSVESGYSPQFVALSLSGSLITYQQKVDVIHFG
ncbi:unnamed protein product, partial [Taenia asiatica]|uniref:Asparaginase n=1 Tax=Taenia asiatica TaxID=60517 RepID=A0A0R3W047_TAEAS